MKNLSFAAIAITALTLAACRQDPEKVAVEHLRRADAYVAQQKNAEALIEYLAAVQATPRMGEAQKKLAAFYLQTGELLNAYHAYSRAADLLPDDVQTQLMVGRILLKAARFDDAKVRAEAVLKKDPNNIDGELLLGNALLGLNNPDDAIAAIEDAIRIAPAESRTYTALGALKVAKSRPQEAEAAFKKAIELNQNSVGAHIGYGYFLWEVQRLAEAEREFKQALQLDQKSQLLHRILFVLYVMTGRPADAESHLQALAKTGVFYTFALADYYIENSRLDDATKVLAPLATRGSVATAAKLRVASIQYAQGHTTEAHATLDQVLKKEPSNSTGLLVKARFLVNDGRSDAALVPTRAAVAADPKNAEAQYLLGGLLAARGDPDEALKAYQEVVKLNPKSLAAELQVAELYLRMDDPDNAAGAAAQAIAMAPNDGRGHMLMARSLLATGDIARADAEVRQLLQKSPKVAAVHTLMASIAMRRQDNATAGKEYARALELDSNDFEAFSGLVTLAALTGRPAEARRLVDARLAKTPDSGPLLVLSARAYLTEKDAVRAEQLLRHAIEVDPTNLPAYAVLGGLYMSEHRLDEALRGFEEITKRQPKSVQAHTMVGIILEAQGEREKATARYQRVLQIDPNAAVASNNLACLLEDSDIDLALKLALKAKERLPSDPDVDDTLGWIYYKMSMTQKAVKFLEDGVKNGGSSPVRHFHLGMAYLRLGLKDKAKPEFEKALKLNYNFPGADEAKKALASIG